MKMISLMLLCSIMTTTLLAQATEIKGARSLKIVSSLPGKSITDVRSILKTEGLKDLDQDKDEELGVDAYYFYPVNTPDKEYEAEYMVVCKNEKVVYISIRYEYVDEGNVFKDDIIEVRRHLLNTGFVLEKETDEDDFLYYVYKLPGKNSSSVVAIDSELATFLLVIGENKYVAIAVDAQ